MRTLIKLLLVTALLTLNAQFSPHGLFGTAQAISFDQISPPCIPMVIDGVITYGDTGLPLPEGTRLNAYMNDKLVGSTTISIENGQSNYRIIIELEFADPNECWSAQPSIIFKIPGFISKESITWDPKSPSTKNLTLLPVPEPLPIPEPITIVLFGTGIASLAGLKLWTKAKNSDR